MDDHREHVIQSLEEAIPFMENRSYGGVAHIIYDALELLKEPEIIRCAECKHWHINCMEIAGRHGCSLVNDYTGPDYYCASAERRLPLEHVDQDVMQSGLMPAT